MSHADAIAQTSSPRQVDGNARLQAKHARLRVYWFRILGCCVVAAALAYIAYEYQTGPAIIFTDDAYVDASLAQVTPQIDGTVSEINVHDTQYVKRGDILVTLDDQDALLDVDAAKAEYDLAYRHVQQNLANVSAAEANVGAKQAIVARAQLQLNRRQGISIAGAVSKEEISDSRTALTAATDDLTIARQQLASQYVLVKSADIQNNPEIASAIVALKRAQLRLRRTEIRAPVDGVIAQFHTQIGQQIASGTSLMSIVPIDKLFVDANFKEGQLEQIKPFQAVDLVSDLYGSDVVYHGHVEGLGGGTGAAFSVIPAQNATGNWIKVVQRLPVRIALDPEELRRNPLRVGISMNVSVHTGSFVGRPARAPDTPPALRTATSKSF
jgi:membrane fusion protein (multidrug efflux system)